MSKLSTALLLMVLIAASGCNTTRGLGQDIEATGEAIEDAAEKTKRQTIVSRRRGLKFSFPSNFVE